MNRCHFKFGPFCMEPFWWWNSDSRAIEAFSGMLAWYWGVLLLLPLDTFGASPSYRIMAAIAPEEIWGTIYCLLGFVQSMALCGGVRYFRGPAAILGVILWSAATIMFAISNPATHALGIYGLLTLANFWVLVRGPMRNGR